VALRKTASISGSKIYQEPKNRNARRFPSGRSSLHYIVKAASANLTGPNCTLNNSIRTIWASFLVIIGAAPREWVSGFVAYSRWPAGAAFLRRLCQFKGPGDHTFKARALWPHSTGCELQDGNITMGRLKRGEYR
jgi:hypothetical protein